MDTLIERIKRHEGLSLKPYVDTEGNLTIGYGHRIAVEMEPISLAKAEEWLKQDIHYASEAVMSLPLVAKLNQTRRGVLTELAFWCGFNGLLRFRKMLSALRQGNFKRAALELYHSQLGTKYPARACELAVLMWEGE